MSRAAILTPKRQIEIVGPAGRTRETFDDVLAWGAWKAVPSTSWAWPTWSPDGRALAAFRMTMGDEPTTTVVTFAPGSVHQTDVAQIGSRLPIYLHWSTDGARVAILSQEDAQLVLSSAQRDEPASERIHAEASPLFFTWAPDHRIAAYLGEDGRRRGQMALLATGSRDRTVLPGVPLNFCAPLCGAGRVYYVAATPEGPALVAASELDAVPTIIEPTRGLVALVPSPDRTKAARAWATDGDGTPYRDLVILDLATGDRRHVADGPFLAFLWVPGGDRLVTARVDTQRNVVIWEVVAPGEPARILHEQHPTRDLGFYLRFFEQFGQSHALVDPTGQWLLLAGWPARAARTGEPRVIRVPLDGGEPDDLGPGNFAVWAPA